MEVVGVAASILAIATAGAQISIKFISFSTQVTTAADRLRSIGSAVSLTAMVLQQIRELMISSDGNAATNIFNNNSLQTTQASAEACERIFRGLKDILMKSSNQLQQQKNTMPGKVKLSRLEALKWPFFQPGIDTLCADLRDARETLMLILQVTTLAYSKKLAALDLQSSLTADEHSLLVSEIVALNQTIASSKAEKEIHNETISPQDEPAAKRLEICDDEIPVATLPPLANKWETDSSQTKQSDAVNPKTRKHFPFRRTAKTAKTNAVSSVTSLHSDAKAGDKSITEDREQLDLSSEHEPANVNKVNNSLRQSPESLNSTRETIFEAVLATPSFDDASLRLSWDGTNLPLKQADIRRKLHKRNWWRRDDLFTQLSRLSGPELRYIETLGNSRKGATISRIMFRKMSPSKDRRTGLSLRRMLILLDCSASEADTMSHYPEILFERRLAPRHHGVSRPPDEQYDNEVMRHRHKRLGVPDTDEASFEAERRGSYMPEDTMNEVDTKVDGNYHDNDLDPEHGDELDEETAERIVNDLLAKYTTLEI